MENEKYLHEATYSPEDDKLRLYLGYRLDVDEYEEVKSMGFSNAPKLGCQFAKWTPEREDFCLRMAGEITPEQTTLVERAEMKASRLDDLSSKRAQQADSYREAANAISERFAYGQPILVGHHSERSARRDKKRMENAMSKSVWAADAVGYWNSRAEGVERHANRKSNPGVRARRIQTLLKELRGYQRDINDSNVHILAWETIGKHRGTEKFAKGVEFLSGRGASPYIRFEGFTQCLYSLLVDGKMTADEVFERSLNHHRAVVNGERKYRCINHVLNRLSFERGELGDVERYEGELTPAILQTFLRTHGADTPKAKKTEGGYKVTCPVPFPLHITEGKALELSEDAWRDKMQNLGYDVPAPKAKKPGIVNFKALAVKVKQWSSVYEYPQIRLTNEEYMSIYPDHRGAVFSSCGTFKVRVCLDPNNQTLNGRWFCVFLEDKKEHPAPDSQSVVISVEEGAA